MLNLGDECLKIHYALLFYKISLKVLLALGSTLIIPSLYDFEHVADPLHAPVSLLSLAASVSNSL